MAEVSILAVNEIAESIGISKLDLSIKRTVSREAEMVILNVIDTAKLQMLMSKREKLKASDINETLHVMKMNKLYGYSNKKTNTEEINLKYTTLHYSPFLDLLFPDLAALAFQSRIRWGFLPADLPEEHLNPTIHQ